MTLPSPTDIPLPDRTAIDLVRESCQHLPEGSTRLAGHFYHHLFQMAPELRGMFAPDLGPQEERMAQALLAVVSHLDTPDEVAGYLRRLGAQHHRELGVRPEHYPYVGRALVRAVSEISPFWSSHTSSAWIVVYRWVSANMIAGAEGSAASASAVPQRSH